jgi:hypothetical protein
MKARLLLNLGLAALVIALALLVWLKPKTSAAPAFRLTTLSAKETQRIAIDKPGQPPLALHKTPAGWRLDAPFSARADHHAVERLLEVLDAASSQRFPAADLGRFQLDQPLLRLTLNEQEFRFGTQNPLTGEIYVATADQVFMVAPRYLASALRMPADFAARSFLAEEDKPDGFDFADLKLTLQGDGKWSVSPPRQDLTPDELNRWRDEWLHASALLAQPYDGTAALATFTLHLRDGRKITCKLLRREPEWVLLREDEQLQYHFPADLGKRLLRPGHA